MAFSTAMTVFQNLKNCNYIANILLTKCISLKWSLLSLLSPLASVSMGVMQFPKSEEFCEVFLSAIDNAGHFWVQLVTTDAPSFDKLTEELTSLYAASESQAILNVFKVGDICCAPFEYDSSWYRARVLEIHKDEMVDLFYLDFGDTGKIPKERLRELK